MIYYRQPLSINNFVYSTAKQSLYRARSLSGSHKSPFKDWRACGKIPAFWQVRPLRGDKHIIREHLTKWSQIYGQINSIDPGLVDTACFRKESPPIHYRQRIPPVNENNKKLC